MIGFTDIHSHFVYGLDDGAQTNADMYALLDAAYADGIRTLVATPHQTPGIAPFDEEIFERHLWEAYAYCQSRGYAMRLCRGAEILYTPALEPYAKQRKLTTYEGTRYVLIEFVLDITLHEMDSALTLLEECNYIPVVAHVERYDCMSGRNAYRMKEEHDVRYQMNCGAVLGGRGFLQDRRVKKWLRDGLIDVVATDMHSVKNRPPKMLETRKALEALVGNAQAAMLLCPAPPRE